MNKIKYWLKRNWPMLPPVWLVISAVVGAVFALGMVRNSGPLMVVMVALLVTVGLGALGLIVLSCCVRLYYFLKKRKEG